MNKKKEKGKKVMDKPNTPLNVATGTKPSPKPKAPDSSAVRGGSIGPIHENVKKEQGAKKETKTKGIGPIHPHGASAGNQGQTQHPGAGSVKPTVTSKPKSANKKVESDLTNPESIGPIYR